MVFFDVWRRGEAVVLCEAWGEEGGLGVEEVGEGTLFLPENVLGEGESFLAHVFGEGGVPLGEFFFAGVKMVESVEVEPLGDEVEHLGAGAWVGEEAAGVLFDFTGIVEGAICGVVDELFVGGTADDEVAEAGSELVGVGWAVGLDTVEEARRLEHGADDVGHRLIEVAAAGADGGGDALEEVDFIVGERAAEEVFSESGEVGAEGFLGEAAVFGKVAGELGDVHFFNDGVGEAGVGFDVLEVDAEVVGGVAEAIGAEVGREVCAGFLAYADAGGGHHGVAVFADGEAAGEVLGLGVEGVRGGVDGGGGPDCAGGDPFFEVGFFLGGKRVAVLGHFVFSNHLPDHAFVGVAGADDVGVGEGGEFLGEVEVALDSGGVVALEAMTREEGLDVRDEKGLAPEACFFGFGEDGFGLGAFFKEG